MELKWLEDMLLLFETRSFSKAAKQRNVTQPAFSRRIRSLESWLGAALVDRRHNPLRFTPAALNAEADIRQLVNRFYELRGRVRAEAESKRAVVFTAQHTLTVTQLPRLLRVIELGQPGIVYRVRSGNRDECVAQMARGEVDFLLCYEAPEPGGDLLSLALRRIKLGTDRLLPVSGCSVPHRPIHVPRKGERLPLLLYPEDSFLGQVLWQERLPDALKLYNVDTVCESAFSVGVREMTLKGLGIAWLPRELIEEELERGLLHSYEELLGSCEMGISLYSAAVSSLPDAESIWQVISATSIEA